jgi:serine/threonine protein kinase
MNCDKCGSENQDDANFCSHCGQALSGIASGDESVPAVDTGSVPIPSSIDETTTQEQFDQMLGGRYKLKEMLGRGGLGVVYSAYDQQLKMDIAIKFLLDRFLDDTAAVENLKREAKAAMQLAHPNIIRLFNFEDTPRAKYLLMELIEGESLASIAERKKDGLFTEAELIKYISKICEALIYAHAQGIVHRDIKPANILVASGDKIKLADFGIARINEAATSRMSGGGTPVYMSPEQILDQEVDARSDIYSLGITMYEMLAGRPPFQGPKLRDDHINTMPDPIENVTEWMNAIVLKCLKKEPDGRWSSAEELRDVLTRKKEIEVGFQTKFQPAWARAEADRSMVPRKTPVSDSSKDEEEAPSSRPAIIKRTPSPSRTASLHRHVSRLEIKSAPDHLAPERDQMRMGYGTLAGILAGVILLLMDKYELQKGLNITLFQMSWAVFGGLIGIAVGVAQKRGGKGLLSFALGVTGGLVAALLVRPISGFPSIDNIPLILYTVICGAIIGAFLGISDGFYELSINYALGCFLWGATGGGLAVGIFVLIRFALMSFWHPTAGWIIMGGVLGLFINMFMGYATKPLEGSPKIYKE